MPSLWREMSLSLKKMALSSGLDSGPVWILGAARAARRAAADTEERVAGRKGFNLDARKRKARRQSVSPRNMVAVCHTGSEQRKTVSVGAGVRARWTYVQSSCGQGSHWRSLRRTACLAIWTRDCWSSP